MVVSKSLYFLILFNVSSVLGNPLFAQTNNGLNNKTDCRAELDSILNYDFIFFDSDFERTIELTSKGIGLARQCGDSVEVARLSTIQGRAYVFSGNYSQGLFCLQKSEMLAREFGSDIELAHSLLNQGNIFYFNDQFVEAIPVYQQVLPLALECKDSTLIAGAYHNIGICYKSVGHIDTAFYFFGQTLQIVEAQGDSNRIMYTIANIADNYFDAGEYNEALQCLQKAIVDDGKYLSKPIYSYAFVNLGKTYFHLNDLEKGEYYLEKGLNMAQELNSMVIQYEACRSISDLSAYKNDFKKSHKYAVKALVLKDSLNQKEMANKLAIMRVEHESEKRDQELKYLRIEKELADAETKRWSVQRNFALLIILLLIIIVGLIINRYQVQKKFNVRLRKEVELKTSELENALEKVERSDKLKTQFLQNMSHEVRTPLNAIHGFSGLLNEVSDRNNLMNDYIHVITKNADYLLEVFDNVTDLSRLENDDFSFYLEDVNIIKVVKSLNEKFIARAIEKYKGKVFVKLILGEGIDENFMARTDKKNLYKMLYMLMDNALKATSDGEIELQVSLDGEFITFQVSDTGIGIPKIYQKEVFYKFRKINLSSKQYLRGAGLGLAICRLMVDKMKGQLWLESEEGAGCKFFIKVPINIQ